jgi:hypothetical protein
LGALAFGASAVVACGTKAPPPALPGGLPPEYEPPRAFDGGPGIDGPHASSGAPVRFDLHVMSQCPYGRQAEDVVASVAPLLGSDLDLHIEFIGNIDRQGDLKSMHGAAEVAGDLLQVCAIKYAPTRALDFISCQNQDPAHVDLTGDACARAIGAPADKIVGCARGQEGKDLLAASFQRSADKHANGSPTFFINGALYDGRRRPKDFLRAICEAAGDKPPVACFQLEEAPVVNVTILGDSRCGEDCDPSRYDGVLHNRLEKPNVRVVDYGSPEGKRLYASLSPSGALQLPALVFDKTLEADAEGRQAFARNLHDANGVKFISAGDWNPTCLDDGGCQRAECASIMQCRVEAPKQLDVFVMSQCPFGVKGLEAMREVLANFKAHKTSLDFRVHFIGDAGDQGLTSMHGPAEVAEDRREICAVSRYGKNLKFMDYLLCRGPDIRSADWQSCTGAATGIDTAFIKSCSEGEEGNKLLAASFVESQKSGMGASPTWLVNNKFKFSGIDAETIKTNICAHNKLAGCEVKLSSEAPMLTPKPKPANAAPPNKKGNAPAPAAPEAPACAPTQAAECGG